ncbi:MAG: glycerol-3-phosphate 1-O-acyltransferase PlsY [Lentisphaeria bacterium]|nr:glycerol-3-phosphate 1-O-acyltransferase PlsY [Lentisphaeria bacterium]
MTTFVENNLPALSVAATLILSYLAGSIPSGFLIGKSKGIDIREHGSGNIGATNVTRIVGKWWGKLCFLCDFLKSAVPVALVAFLCRKEIFADPWGLLPSLAAFSAVAGHIFPVWLKFKGGKGISTAAGAVLALNPPALLAAGIVWAALFFAFRYVSLASIFAAAGLPFFAWGAAKLGLWNCTNVELGLFILLGVLAIVKHISNIKRLLNGTESRFVKKKEETAGEEK